MLCNRILNNFISLKHSWPVFSSKITHHVQINSQHNFVHNVRSAATETAKLSFPFLSNALRCHYCTGTGVVEQQKEQPGMLKRVLKKVGFAENSKARLRVTSHVLYESVADKINYLKFFSDFQLPNTFNSWFLVTELHVWMLLVRAMAEGAESGQDGRFLRNFIVEAMWGDVNARGKKLGANNPSRTRAQIELLSEQFQAALIAYDEGIMSDDRILAAALWRRFFEMNCDDYQKIERMVKYVRNQITILDNIQREQFIFKPKIPWLNLENVTV